MARPQRNNVDYFPFLCKEGPTTYYIEQKYGNDGFATWIKLLRQLAVTDYHYLNISDRPQLMFLSAKCKVPEDTLLAIIQDLCDMGEFESFLWKENRVIFSTKFVRHIEDAYAKRSNKCITLRDLVTLLEGLGVRKPHNELDKLPLKAPVNPQRKEEYSKEEKTIVEESEDAPDFEKEIFGDQIFIENMRRMFPDVDMKKSWIACKTYFDNQPRPPSAGWMWRQKFQSWLDNDQNKINEQRAKTKGRIGQIPIKGNGEPRKKWDWNA